MAVKIRTPFPSIESVARAVGLPVKRAREIGTMVSSEGDRDSQRTITATDLRVRTSEVLEGVQRLGRVTVTLRGKPIAPDLYARREARARLERLRCHRNVGEPQGHEESGGLGSQNSPASAVDGLFLRGGANEKARISFFDAGARGR
jgi:antitoxin (DNA-binding transcriptional repressor) of toxin-antitoxin stability system